MLALAYGTEGEDYDVLNGEIKMRDGKKERTLGDLTNGGNKLIEGVRLADVMEADNDDAIMMYLLYGKKDTHYQLVGDSALNSERTPVPLQKQIAVLDYNDVKTPYNVYGDTKLDDTINEEITTYTVDGVTYYLSPVSKTVNITVKNASNEDEDVASNLYYVYEDEAKQIPVMFEPTSLGELMNDSSIISNLTGRLTLEEVMGKEALSGTPMEKLGGYIIDEVPDKIETLQLKDIFDEEDLESSKILSSLGESTLASLSEDVDKLTFSDIFTEDEVKDNNVLTYLYNAKDPDTEELYPITELTKAIDAMAVKDVFSPTEIDSNPILKSLATDKNGEKVLIKNMSARLDELTVGDVFGDEIFDTDNAGNKTPKDDANPILVSLANTKIIELDQRLNTLTVGEVFDDKIFDTDNAGNKTPKDDANPILVSLANTKIINLDERMNTLTVGEVFEDEIYDKDDNGNLIPQKDKDGNPIVDDKGNPVYVKGSWYYLLKDPSTGGIRTNYKLTSEMNVMMTNMSANMKTASLKELNQMGIIDLSAHKDTLLSTGDKGKINYMNGNINANEFGNKTYFYQLTVEELFNYVGALLGSIPTTP